MHLAFATSRDNETLFEDDIPLKEYLESKNIKVSIIIWDDTNLDYTLYDAIIIRSVWDYFLRIDEFTKWLDLLFHLKIKVFNPIHVLHINKHKKYLFDFQRNGITIPPTLLIKKDTPHDLQLSLDKWDKVVIKPIVSAGAYKTWIVDQNNIDTSQIDLDVLLKEQDVLIQKFAREIVEHGELSLIYFNKKFSHAVLKIPKQGDFRVQHQYGGQNQKIIPSESLLNQIEIILGQVPDDLLYARVDGYLDAAGTFYLMELELLEPVLFIKSDVNAPDRFYKSLIELMQFRRIE